MDHPTHEQYNSQEEPLPPEVLAFCRLVARIIRRALQDQLLDAERGCPAGLSVSSLQGEKPGQKK